MAALDVDRPLYGRGPSPGLRFTLYAILSIVLMYYDRHGQLVQRMRYLLDAAAYPVQVAVGSPGTAWHWLSDSWQTRATLRAENSRLQAQLRELELRTMRQAALEKENEQLRDLRASLPPLIKSWQLAQIIDVETDPLRQRVIVDKGARDGVTPNQAVVDAHGILGQVERVGPWSAEVILLTDPEAAVPVQVTRDGLRTIAVGGGSAGDLLLPYLGTNADVQDGDLLVTSGLGGVYPAGFPVARVLATRRPGEPQAMPLRAHPLAQLTRDREVILLQFSAGNPAAPAPKPAIAPAGARSAGGTPDKPARAHARRPASQRND